MLTKFFAAVAATYRRSGFQAAVEMVSKKYPDMTPQQAHDLAHDIIFEFMS